MPSFESAITEFVSYKIKKNRRPGYIYSLKWHLTKFAKGREDTPVSELTPQLIEEHFIDPNSRPATQNSVMGRLSTFFTFCAKRDYVTVNPMLKLDRPTIERSPPVIFSPTEARTLLNALRARRPDLLAYVTLGLFCGVRPHEIKRLNWSDIDLNSRTFKGLEGYGLLTISAAASKVRRRRLCPIPPNAVEWLRLCKAEGSVSPVIKPTQAIVPLSETAGVKWGADILRHSAASYLIAEHQDAPKIAMWLGNSPSILLNHYFQLVSPDDCAAFWSITPTP